MMIGELFILAVRRPQDGDWLPPKTLSEFHKICLVDPAVTWSVLCCPQKSCPLELENFSPDNRIKSNNSIISYR